MTYRTPDTLKTYFETGDKPTQAEFGDFIDSVATEVVNVCAYGAVGDGVTDDTAAIQLAIDTLTAQAQALTSRKKYIIVLNGVFKCTSTITVPANFISLHGPAILNFDSTTSTVGLAITTSGDGDSAYNSPECSGLGSTNSNVLGGFKDLEIIGPNSPGSCSSASSDDGSTAITIDGTSSGSGTNSAHIRFDNLFLSFWGKGVDLQDHTYNIAFYHCRFAACFNAINFDSGRTNAGERISLYSCTFSSSQGAAIKSQNPDVGFYAHSCSFDFVNKAVDINGTSVVFYGCHVETGWEEYLSTDPVFEVRGNSGNFMMYGGTIILGGESATRTNAILVSAGASDDTYAVFNGVDWTSPSFNATDVDLAAGTGDVVFRDSKGTKITNLLNIGSNFSSLFDGDMEDSGISDYWFLESEGGSSPSDPYSTSNLTLQKSSAQARNGTRSLQFQKGSGTSSGRAMLIVPIARGDVPKGRIFYKITSSGVTGTLNLTYSFSHVRFTTNGVPRFIGNTQIAGSTINLSNAPIDWTAISLSGINRAPNWANYLTFDVNISSSDTIDIFLDDAEIYLW